MCRLKILCIRRVLFQGELIGGKFGKAEPLLIFGILSVIAGLLLLLLPETYGQKLPDTMKEGEEFGRYTTVY